jgi:hypothetical protein
VAAGTSGGTDVAVIAAGVGIPLVLLALLTCCAAAALLLWRRRKRDGMDESVLAMADPSLGNAMTISPLYVSQTRVHQNELYVGDHTSDLGFLGRMKNRLSFSGADDHP